MEVHRKAVGWPEERFGYVGVDVKGDKKEAYDGEEKYGYQPYLQDLYGCHGFLAEKRLKRNTAARFHPYFTSAPEIVDLMAWCPKERTRVYGGPLPWSST